jgi:hypothetical protein
LPAWWRSQGLISLVTTSSASIGNFLTNGLGIFNFDYGYMKKRVKMHWGVYRTTFAISPVNLIDLTSLNGLFYYPPYIGSVMKIGGYFGLDYPMTPFRFTAAAV